MTRVLDFRIVLAVTLLAGCDGGPEPTPADDGGVDRPLADGGGSRADSGPVCVPRASTEAVCGDGADDDCDGLTDCADPDCDAQACGADGFTCIAGGCGRPFASELPELPGGVRAEVRGDTVTVHFLPVAGAADYRIYVEPDPADVVEAADGSLTIAGATYRCSGDRPLGEQSNSLRGEVLFFNRRMDDAVLGHVYLTGGEGRTPVYALGHPEKDWRYTPISYSNSRVHHYTTDEAERAARLAEGWRDDGIAFYVPSDGGDVMLRRFASTPQAWIQNRTYTLVFPEGSSEHDARRDEPGEHAPMFRILGSPEVDASGRTLTVPLYRVHWDEAELHDELAPGEGLRDRFLRQGNQPVTALTWSGLTERTTLVIEALDRGCPFGGILGPVDRDARGYAEPFVAPETARAASPSGELWINGQHAPSGTPVPTHRARVTVSPQAPPSMDFFADFLTSGTGQEWERVETRTGVPGVRYRSALFDLDYVATEAGTDGIGEVLGELWIGFADWAADTNGKVRLAPLQRGTVASDSYFHATMEATLPSTHRRYPQLMISTVAPPLAGHMSEGTTVIVQSFDAATELQIQLCRGREWDVNAQCPMANVSRFGDRFAPHPVVAESVGFDRRNRIDVYLSTSRVYAYFDGRPYGCADLPSGAFAEAQPVSLHVGSVLYHSGVDEAVVCSDCPHRFLRELHLTQSVVHYDDIGFSSGVALPSWDHTAMPCASGFRD